MRAAEKWILSLTIGLCLVTIGVQIGMYAERSRQDYKIALLMQSIDDISYELDIERLKVSIIACESGLRHYGIWGDGGKSYGIAQFQARTFNWLRSLAGRDDLSWYNAEDQLWLLDWALRNGYGSYWSCYQRAKEGVRDDTTDSHNMP